MLPAQDESDDFQITYETIAPHPLCCADCKRLRAAIEDYSLWRPGEKGHAAAHRKLMEALR